MLEWFAKLLEPQALVAFVALGVALWAGFSTQGSKRAAQGNVIGRLLADYAAPKTSSAMEIITAARPTIEARVAGHISRAQFPAMLYTELRAYTGQLPPSALMRLAGFKNNAGTLTEPTEDDLRGIVTQLHDAGRNLHWFVRQGEILLQHKIITPELFEDAIASTNGYRLWAECWLPYAKAQPESAKHKQPEDELQWANRLLRLHPPRDPNVDAMFRRADRPRS